MTKELIQINEPIFGEEEFAAVSSVLTSGKFTVSAYSLNGGENVQRFEKKLSKFTDTKHCISTNSGTSALETSLLALGIGPGDNVIIPSLTFVATANAVVSVGAKPIFCDVDGYGQMDYDQCKKLSEQYNTKCIIFVDLYGRISKNAADFKNLAPYVIEDSCQSLGTPKAGTFGDVGCFSFYASKVCTTMGMGGAVITDDDNLSQILKLKRNHGIVPNLGTVTPGRNNILNECNAAFGCVQLDKLPGFIKTRNENMESLGLFENTNGYMGTMLVDNRDAIINKLFQLGIVAGKYYQMPIHIHKFYQGDYDLPITNHYAKCVLNLPVHPNVKPEHIELMKKTLEDELS